MDSTLVEYSPTDKEHELEAVIEDLRQKNFELARSNQSLQMINADAASEIESLNEALKEAKKSQLNEKQIIRIEAVNETDTEKIINLENEVKTACLTIDKLKKELEEWKNKGANQEKSAEKLLEELAGFESMKKTNDDLHSIIEAAEKEKTELILKYKVLEERLSEIQEALEAKNCELRELNAAYKEVKDENALLSSQIATLNSQPASETQRGNSLFAEVEDHRQVMRRNLQLMAMKCEKYKRLYVSQTNEINALRLEKNRFKSAILSSDDELEKKFFQLASKHEERIRELERDLIELLEKRPESPQIIPVSENDNNLKWVPVFVNKAREEADNLRKEKYQLQREILHLSNDVYRHELNNNILKKDKWKLEAQIDELKRQNEHQVSEKENSPPVIQPVKEVRFDEGTKG